MIPIIPNLRHSAALKPVYEEAQTWSRTEQIATSEASANNGLFVASSTQSGLSPANLLMPAPITKAAWNSQAKKRFSALVKKKSASLANDDEKRELESLQAVRREAEQDIRPEQVLFEIRRDRAIQEITAVFERYSVTIGSVPKSFIAKGKT
jgi:hypothetical protein